MINLLPPDVKNGYHFARRNVSLRRWVIIFLIALVGLGSITTYGLLTIHQSTVHYNKQIADSTDSLKQQNYVGAQAQVKNISNSFSLVVQVLSKEILFSKLLQQIGATMPRNSNLTGISIAQTQGGLDVTAVAADYATATQVQVNLSDPTNKIFSKADILNINCYASEEAEEYPCTVVVRALFAADNPYLLINKDKAKP